MIEVTMGSKYLHTELSRTVDMDYCCILYCQHRLRRLMRQPIWGMHHERLREPRNDLNEQGPGVSHQRLHYRLPLHAHQLLQWLHQTWPSNRVLTLKSLSIKIFSLLPTFFRNSCG